MVHLPPNAAKAAAAADKDADKLTMMTINLTSLRGNEATLWQFLKKPGLVKLKVIFVQKEKRYTIKPIAIQRERMTTMN